MKSSLSRIILAVTLFSSTLVAAQQKNLPASSSLGRLLDNYYSERMQLLPMEATSNGDTLYNDRLYADFTDSYRSRLKAFFFNYLKKINAISSIGLSETDRISYDVFKREMQLTLEGLNRQYFASGSVDHQYIPFTQFGGVPSTLGQLGSGDGAQPFKTVRDHENWLKRAASFSSWSDSAIVYFRKGLASGIVLPEALVKKMITQMEAMIVTDPTKSLFYGPVGKIPQGTTEAERGRLTNAYVELISRQLLPSYQKLAHFLRNEYLPRARKTTGISALPAGKANYQWLINYWTTTNLKPEAIYQTGLSEVARIRRAMDSIRKQVGFTGDLQAFFQYMRTDRQFMPFQTEEEVLNAFRSIQSRIDPNLKKMFNKVPKTPFEIRQTEAFRAASASAEYNQGSPDGSRPGIFYVPIVDPKAYNVTSGMDGLFLHEAIPGHHYQISLQIENEKLPKFRRFSFYGAYVEGWGLYAESLGKELGVYTDPYQYMGALVKEMHRSVRLVVDAGMHTRNMTREQSIRYMMDNMPFNEQRATAETERYMAMPGQALSYKIGQLKIIELRKRYEKQLGKAFNLAAFHDALLQEGALPLDILERRMNSWAARQKQ